jgi:hypothetical protein
MTIASCDAFAPRASVFAFVGAGDAAALFDGAPIAPGVVGAPGATGAGCAACAGAGASAGCAGIGLAYAAGIALGTPGASFSAAQPFARRRNADSARRVDVR